MNKFYYLLLMLLFVGCSPTESKHDDAKLFKMEIVKQGIERINSYEYFYKFGEVDSSTKFLKESVEFDRNGNGIKVLTYTRKDSLEHPVDSTVNVFDSKGNIIKSIQTRHWRSIDLDKLFTTEVVTLENKYENDKRIELIQTTNGKLTRRTNYKYNSNGKVAEFLSYGTDGDLENKTVYSYSNGVESGSKTYDKDGKLDSRSEVIKKDKTHTIYNSYNEKDSLDSSLECILNEKGWVLKNTYKSGDYFSNTATAYNNWGLITTIIKYNKLGEPETLTKNETK